MGWADPLQRLLRTTKIFAPMKNKIPPRHADWAEVELHTKYDWFPINGQTRPAGNIKFSRTQKPLIISPCPIINHDDSSYHQYWWEEMCANVGHHVRPLGDNSHNNQHMRLCVKVDCWLLDLVEKWDVDQPDPAVCSPFPSIINIDERRCILFLIINIDDRDEFTSIINIDDRSDTTTFLLSSISMIGLAHRCMMRVSDLLVMKHNSFYLLIPPIQYSVVEIKINGFFIPWDSARKCFWQVATSTGCELDTETSCACW